MIYRRFDDIIEKFESGELINVVENIDAYNKRTTKWNFWEYLYQTIKGAENENMKSEITWQSAFELAVTYLNQKSGS